MKANQIICTLALLFAANMLHAQDYGLYWKYKDYDGSISFTIPRFLVDMGALFVKEHDDRNWLLKVHKVRTMVFTEKENPVTAKDWARFNAKAKRRHLDELLTVRQGKDQVRIMAKERGNAIRKIVVIVSNPDDFFMVTLKGKLRWDDINGILNKYGKDIHLKDKADPKALKIPVKKV
jgi:formylglycine-generating enzyme required for sulfatase activity